MSALFEYHRTQHTPKNINQAHKDEQQSGTPVQRFNAALAVHATLITSSVWCFYFFLVISLTGFPGIPWISCTPQAFVAWFSSQFLQLILLPLIAAGTAIVGRRQELLADEQYQFAVKTYADTEQMLHHLDAQDAELLRHADLLEQLVKTITPPPAAPAVVLAMPARDEKGRFLKPAATPDKAASLAIQQVLDTRRAAVAPPAQEQAA